MAAEEPVPGRGRSVAAVLAAAEDEKAAGNVCFKAGDVKGAVKAYKKAFLTSHSLRCANETSAMYGGSTAPTEEEKAAVAAFTMALYGNLTACYLKAGDSAKALKYAKLAAEVAGPEPPAKVALRLGKAYLAVGDLYNADEVLTAAAKRFLSGPEAAAIRKALTTARSRSRSASKALGSKLAAAFGS